MSHQTPLQWTNVAAPDTADTVEHAAPQPSNHDALADFRLNRRQQMIRSALHMLYRISPDRGAQVAAFLFLRPRRKPVTYIDSLPDGATPITAFHNLRKLVGYSWGTGDKTVLLVHGWESHLGNMLPLVQPLVDAGMRVIAFDSPGHGQSPQLTTNMYDVGEAVRAIIEQHEPVHGIVANSFGAAATTMMLMREPQVKLSRLVLVSPIGHFEHHLSVYTRLTGVDGDLETAMRERIESQVSLPIAHFDVAEGVKSLTVPGLVIHDRYDPIIPVTSSQRIAAQWRGATYEETCYLGHKDVLADRGVQAMIREFLCDKTSPPVTVMNARV